MRPANSESPEASAKNKCIAEFVETVMERTKDYSMDVDSI
jgi:hypothetical protein